MCCYQFELYYLEGYQSWENQLLQIFSMLNSKESVCHLKNTLEGTPLVTRHKVVCESIVKF